MIDTFLVYQVSPKETIRYEIPNALKDIFEEVVKNWPPNRGCGPQSRKVVIDHVLALLKTVAPDLVAQVVRTTSLTLLWPRGHEASFIHYDDLPL